MGATTLRPDACRVMLATAACAATIVVGCSDRQEDAPHTVVSIASPEFDVLATALEAPWAMQVAPDGRLFLTERPGRVRVIGPAGLDPEPWAVLPAVSAGETGLMGLALAPDFDLNPAVYVALTVHGDGDMVVRIVRIPESDGRGGVPELVADRIPASTFHSGTALLFGPDGTLYVSTGDAQQPSSAADPSALTGKILRFNSDGSLPSDNPTPASPVFASGLRNVQGMCFTSDGDLLAVEHGPSGFPNERLRQNHDELNQILAGADYGWPRYAGSSSNPEHVAPLIDWTPGIAPAGVGCTADSTGQWDAVALVGALKGEQLRRVFLRRDAGGLLTVQREEILFEHELGRIRAITVAPDGAVYLGTSNRDGRGTPAAADDRIVRLRPR